MLSNLNLEYFKILLFFIVSLLFISILIGINSLLVKDSSLINKKKPVECGAQLFGSGKMRLEINFFIVAIIFVVFEIELLVIIPWILLISYSYLYSIFPVLIFLFVLTVGLVFEYLSGQFLLNQILIIETEPQHKLKSSVSICQSPNNFTY
jgi:NADH-quinone oxidoreductase subunit A